jgi:tetratricopeptide (TPR) repeat protein
MNLFNQVVSEYEARPKAARDALDNVFLRNAYFYRADCAFDLERYEQAIALYDMAAKRYENHPASLVALIQQVNAHCELGQYQAARVANDRARFQLRRIPDEAFNDPSLPMTRSQWEDWLKWTSELNLFDAQANAATQ